MVTVAIPSKRCDKYCRRRENGIHERENEKGKQASIEKKKN